MLAGAKYLAFFRVNQICVVFCKGRGEGTFDLNSDLRS